MEGYKKTELKNHLGQILLPLTTATMVSEEPDRRFVDNIEKILLNKLATEEDAVVSLVENVHELVALASQETVILKMIEDLPNNIADFGRIIDELNVLTPHTEEILEKLTASPVVHSATSNLSYSIGVDDRDPLNPILTLIKQETMVTQPLTYRKGDIWKVGENAPDVLLRIPIQEITTSVNRKTILTFDEGLESQKLSDPEVENIMNGVQNRFVSSKGDFIPQIFSVFDVKNYIEKVLSKGLEDTITRYRIEVLTRPGENTLKAVTQAYVGGNVVQPTRESLKREDYTSQSFSNMTWEVTTSPEFVKEFLNEVGKAALVTYGASNSSVGIAKPKLEVYIKNPYIGKTLEATRNMEGPFNILDWSITENE